MARIAFLVVLAISLCFLSSALLGDEDKDPLQLLDSADAASLEKAYRQIQKKRTETIQKLIEYAGRKVKQEFMGTIGGKKYYGNPNRDCKHLSIMLLGKYRAGEAVPVLIKNLVYRNAKAPPDYNRNWDIFYPAAEALAEIGMLAVKPLFEHLSGISELNLSRKLCGNILIEIFGKELAGTALKNYISQVKDEKKKTNLEAALKYIEAWTESDKWVDKE